MMPRRAMVLAAGMGVRMKPLTDRIPKPLVKVGGKAMIDYVLDRLDAVGVERVVINVHYLADVLERHLAGRKNIVISDERDQILETGGGVVRALPLLGAAAFFLVNSDTIWIDGVQPNLARLAAAFDAKRMDALLLLAPTATSVGYSGRGDYAMAPSGELERRGERGVVPFVYAGAAIFSPALFA
ncbi:MAG TPA: nucleotidyltransferase family protein, partial [Xanthobacteraceae bacterium]|nr:nucleotidyltransferase family protein [Xanthobacteraceae bacterium]